MKPLSLWCVVLPLLLLAACSQDAPVDEPATQIKVEDFQYNRLPGGGRIVSGTLHNQSAEPIKNAQIQISLFDADNRFVSSMIVTVRDVPPGAHKPFRYPVDASESIQGARVRSVLIL